MKVIRTMVRLAIKNGDFPEKYYPFKYYTDIKRDKKLTTRDYLGMEEVLTLEQLYKNYCVPNNVNDKSEWLERQKNCIITPGEYETLKKFLFSCYTGLRFTDAFM